MKPSNSTAVFSVSAVLVFTAVVYGGCSNVGGNKMPKSVDSSQSNAVSSVSPQVGGSSVLTGSLSLQSPCTAGPIRLSVQTGAATVYDTLVDAQGTYEFHVTPGSYQVRATTNQGCAVQGAVTLQSNQVGRMNLMLQRSTSSPLLASNGTMSGTGTQVSGTTLASPVNVNGQVSPTDGVYSCPWWVYGCQGYPYPGSGGGVVGKPNVYLSATPGTRFHIKVRAGSGSNVLAATPALGQIGWIGEINSDGTLLVEKAQHRFLYYDMRIDVAPLQAIDGFCVGREKLVPQMVEYLRDRGFLAAEIKDFEDYWATHKPALLNYCVYPQESHEVSSIADLEIQPRPDTITRVWFFIIPQVGESKDVSRFFVKPARTWSYAQFQARLKGRSITSEGLRAVPTAPSADGIKSLREWGIGFLVHH